MRKTFGVSLYTRPAKVKKDGRAPVEVSITCNGQKASFQLDEYYPPEEFARLRDSNRTNEVKRLCGKVTAEIAEIRGRHPEADSATLKRYYLQGDPLVTRIGRITVRRLCDIYLKEVVNGLPSYDKYRVTYDRFCSRFAYKSAGDITAGDVKGFLLDLKTKEGFAQGTLRNYYKRLRSLYETGVRLGIVQVSPFATLRMTFQDPDPVFLDFQEYLAFKTVHLEQEYLRRTRDAWVFMANTGLEWTDLYHLEPGDVKEQEGGFLYIKKPRYKTNVEYFTVLVDEAPRLWLEYDKKIPCPPNQDFNRWLKKIAEKAGISKNVTTLTARHTMASLLVGGYLGDRIPAEVLMKALGHNKINQSLRYMTLTEDSQLMAYKDIKK